MTDYLSHMAARSIHLGEALRPNLPSLFEQVPASEVLFSIDIGDKITSPFDKRQPLRDKLHRSMDAQTSVAESSIIGTVQSTAAAQQAEGQPVEVLSRPPFQEELQRSMDAQLSVADSSMTGTVQSTATSRQADHPVEVSSTPPFREELHRSRDAEPFVADSSMTGTVQSAATSRQADHPVEVSSSPPFREELHRSMDARPFVADSSMTGTVQSAATSRQADHPDEVSSTPPFREELQRSMNAQPSVAHLSTTGTMQREPRLAAGHSIVSSRLQPLRDGMQRSMEAQSFVADSSKTGTMQSEAGQATGHPAEISSKISSKEIPLRSIPPEEANEKLQSKIQEELLSFSSKLMPLIAPPQDRISYDAFPARGIGKASMRPGGNLAGAEASSSSESKSTIRVSIGKIEVRTENKAMPAPLEASIPSPRLSLDEYLKRRNEGQL